MAYLHEHCADCQKLLGREWKEVHLWLDALFKEYGQDHRCHRHHVEGIEETRRMWGDEAAVAAKIHIIVDCWASLPGPTMRMDGSTASGSPKNPRKPRQR